MIDCDAVLFDMDGTLVDSRQIVERIWLHWAAEHRLAPEAVLAVAHGRRTFETMQLVAPELATPEEAARLDALEAEQEGGEVAVLGAAALLDAIAVDRWAVVTSAARHIALSRLATVGLPASGVLVAAEDVPNGKPAPDGYLRAAEQLHVAPRRCIVIEDTPAGVQAGRAAGATVIGLLTTFPRLDQCDVVIPDLRAIRAEATARFGPIRLVVDTG
ncbi:MAG: HAD-IA family hydrolase [Vicinamibacterales bacterium]